ncbi:hypothetical protein APR41_16090 [Salegentibacter salinarum]|uniref:Uncharacterized protein n=1 Tax=Salegentibacter salinarum TaxID=447422 RepID=A0A2N0TXK8_9FLAO|nr:DUF6520 family protein [Salegentibacter salinarum]PKD19480.1 hypothetical protein APR41_16090 [Salegentibacter salinarum]SKB91697.1 hypothetical protein SAMN05660903_03245 [Salegentibacter salinarum]
MKLKKFLLPMMAFIFAIGMAFATVNMEPEPEIPESDNYATMYVHINGEWYDIQVDCEIGTSDCIVEFDEDPTLGATYEVYNSDDFNDPAEGGGIIKSLEGFPPTDDN